MSTVLCNACGQETPLGFPRCANCGATLAVAEPAREERKVVTVLFADLVGSTARAEALDPEDVRAILAPFYARLRSELERFGGTVEKFIGDAVMAVFGAPIAHEDDPERAVRAALAIRDWALEEDSIQVRIAVHTGEALVALGARPAEGEGMVAGDVVNTAARLQSAAPVNGILVGEQTYRATERAIEYRAAEAIVAKGKTEPIPVWEAVQARAAFGVDVRQVGGAPLVGREEELDVLVDALNRARRGRTPQLVTLVGVPGIGKSRLVWELFGRLDADPDLVTWRQGRSLPYGEGISFWALGEIAKAQAGILETDSPDEAERKLRALCADLVADTAERGWVESHLRPLVGLGVDAGPGGDQRDEAFAAWRRFFEALAERGPLVLVFEDLHWADDGLLDFVDHLVDWASDIPLLVIGTARPELLSRRPGWGGGKPNTLTVSLPTLSDGETARVVHALLERTVIPAEVQAALLERAGGNPLYAEEFVRLLGQSRSPAGLPESVQGIISARIDELSRDEKEVLQAAAVLGKVFWLGGLASVQGGDPRRLETLLHMLERKEFVRRERRSSVAGETEYAFRHALVRDVAYEQLPRADRADRHSRAADWIVSLGRQEDHAEMVAHHYLTAFELTRAAGRDPERLSGQARAAAAAAGDRSFALSAPAQAARFYATALELWPADDPERSVLLFRLGKSLALGEAKGDETLAEARDALLACGNVELAAEAETQISQLQWNAGDTAAARGSARRAAALVRASPPSPSKAYVFAGLARVLILAGLADEAAEVAREALAMAEGLGRDDLAAPALTTLGLVRCESGDEGGIDDLERGIERALRAGSPESARGYANLAGSLHLFGRIQEAYEAQEQGRRAALRYGNAMVGRALGFLLPWQRYWEGRWPEAQASVDELEAEIRETYDESSWHYVRGSLALARGGVDDALEAALAGADLARQIGDPQVVYHGLLFPARVLVECGRDEEALPWLDEVLGLLDPTAYAASFESPHLAVVGEALGQVDRVLPVLERMGATPWREAALAYVQGDPARAADVYAEMTLVPYEMYVRLRAARRLIDSGRRAEADQQLNQALAFYRSVGATRYIAEAEALLAESA